MIPYHKIDTVFKRDPENLKRLIEGEYSNPSFEYLAINKWDFTEKVDGSNIRIMSKKKGQIEFGGKTDTAQIPAKLVKHLNDTFLPKVDALDAIFPYGGCLYGEGYGAGIQSGGNYRPDQAFILFDVLIIAEDERKWFLQYNDIVDVAGKLGIPVVPIIGRGTLRDMVEMVRNGFKSTWGNFMAEGIVAKPAVELLTRSGNRIITKIKHKDFVKKG